MAATATDIANDTLQFIGEESITNIDVDSSKRAKMCKRWLPIVRAALLREQPWNFVLRRARLAESSEAPLYEYAHAYKLPSDCIRLFTVNGKRSTYKVEGEYILTNDAECYVQYVVDTEDYSKFPPDLRLVLVYRLGLAVTMVLTGKAPVANLCANSAREAFQNAISADSTENSPDDPIDRDDWVEARR